MSGNTSAMGKCICDHKAPHLPDIFPVCMQQVSPACLLWIDPILDKTTSSSLDL